MIASSDSGRFLAFSEAESKRFGVRIARGSVPSSAPPDAVARDIESLQPDVAIFRSPAGNNEQARTLIQCGLTPLHADTLVYYDYDLRIRPPLRSQNGFLIRAASPGDGDDLAAIVRRSFSGYRNHYHANTLFDKDSIIEGYVEWALSYAKDVEAENRRTWIISGDENMAGFASCRTDPSRSEIEVVLNAVDPALSRRGFYTHLLNFMLEHYHSIGLETFLISTQVWNYAVQRAWARSGLMLRHALDTYHVNVPLRTIEGE